jgi:general secretion pathway protein A
MQRQVFTDKALKKIHAFSRGYPRLINIICDRALLDGYSMDLQTIDHKIINESARELSLPREMGQQTLRELIQRMRTRLRRATSIAIFACLVLFLAASGYFIASRFLIDHGFNLRKFYGTLFGTADRNLPENPSGKTGIQKKDPSSPSAPLLSQPSSEANPLRNQESNSQKENPLGVGSSAGLETSEQGNPFRESKLVVPFGYDTNDLPPETLAKLDELARYLLRKTDSDIVIRGYTDAQGSKEYNKNLSGFRANVVKSYLAGKGISPTRMRAIGMGDAAPRMSNTTSDGRNANRRVEIELVAHGAPRAKPVVPP